MLFKINIIIDRYISIVILQEKTNAMKWRERLDHVIADAQAQVRYDRALFHCPPDTLSLCLSVCLSVCIIFYTVTLDNAYRTIGLTGLQVRIFVLCVRNKLITQFE